MKSLSMGLVLSGSLVLGFSLEAQDGIEVTATGTASAPVTRITLNYTLSADADTPPEALAKYESALRRVTKAFEQSEIPGVSTKSTGPRIDTKPKQDPRATARGFVVVNEFGAISNGADAFSGGCRFRDDIAIAIDGLAGKPMMEILTVLAEVMEISKELKLRPVNAPAASSNRVRYVGNPPPGAPKPKPFIALGVAEPDKIRREARQRALAEARAKAEQLAEISGVTLGRVELIRVEAPAEIGDGAVGEVSAECRLRVRFAIQN